jgi:hypothetical protein
MWIWSLAPNLFCSDRHQYPELFYQILKESVNQVIFHCENNVYPRNCWFARRLDPILLGGCFRVSLVMSVLPLVWEFVLISTNVYWTKYWGSSAMCTIFDMDVCLSTYFSNLFVIFYVFDPMFIYYQSMICDWHKYSCFSVLLNHSLPRRAIHLRHPPCLDDSCLVHDVLSYNEPYL